MSDNGGASMEDFSKLEHTNVEKITKYLTDENMIFEFSNGKKLIVFINEFDKEYPFLDFRIEE